MSASKPSRIHMSEQSTTVEVLCARKLAISSRMADAQKNALDSDLLTSIAKQMLTRSRVKVGGKSLVRRTSSQRLRTVVYEMNGREYRAVGQWGRTLRSQAEGAN